MLYSEKSVRSVDELRRANSALTNDLKRKKAIAEIKGWAMQKCKIVSPPTDGINRRCGLTIDLPVNMRHRMCLKV